MSEKINLSLFEEIFESSSPANYAKMLINTKNLDKNKEMVEEIKDRLSDLEERIKKMSKTEKKNKNADETLEIIEKVLHCNKNVQKMFGLASKVDKGKSKPKTEESIASIEIKKAKIRYNCKKINK